MDSPFRPLKSQWIAKIRKAEEVKEEEFGKTAKECQRFVDGPYNFLYDLKQLSTGDFVFASASDKVRPQPSLCVTINKAAELEQIFGPVLYHKNPTRKATPRELLLPDPGIMGGGQDPMMQQQFLMLQQQAQQSQAVDSFRAKLIEKYLDFTPLAFDLKANARRVINEAIVKGMGILVHETFHPVGASWKGFGSFYRTVDDLVADPDQCSFEDAKWVAFRCVHPVWEVEQKYGLAPGSLKGTDESQTQSAVTDADEMGKHSRNRGVTCDLLTYWVIYSKMGMGSRMNGPSGGPSPETQELEVFGDYVKLVMCDAVDWPLNLPPEIWGDMAEMQKRVQWEVPYWMNDDWPFTRFYFHEAANKMWPIAHLKPGLGLLKLINWCYSFVASRIQHSSRDLVAIAKSASKEIKRAIQSGSDYEFIEIANSQGEDVSKMVNFLKFSELNGDLWKVLMAMEEKFEKATGLNELMYGQTSASMRSAAEAELKSNQLMIRPDDMANKVEDAMSEAAWKEALGARWTLEPQADIAPILGPQAAMWWQQVVTPVDPSTIVHQIEYRVESGSIRKPNKDKDIADSQTLMQTLFPFYSQFAMQTGQVQQFNNLLVMWGKANDRNVSGLLLQPPPMPMSPQAPPQPGGGPGPQRA